MKTVKKDKRYFLVSNDYADFIPNMTRVLVLSTASDDPDEMFDRDEQDLSYVVVEGGEGWVASGYVKTECLYTAAEILELVEKSTLNAVG
jgi:hypothetical protein